MLTFSKNLYIGETIKEKKINLYKLGLKQGRGLIKLYLITLSNNESDQLDIIHNSLLKQRLYRKLDLRVVGLCNSRSEAIDIVNQIVAEAVENTGKADIKDYLIKNFE